MNYLLKGLGSRQKWLSTISEARLIHLIKTDVEFQPGLLHGNPWKDRKIVFNADLVDRGELTPWTVVKSATIIPALLAEIRSACEEAKRTTPNCSVLLLVFGHGESLIRVKLNDDGLDDEPSCYLSLEQLQEAIDPTVEVAIVTTACHSREWATNKNLNATVITAAGTTSCQLPGNKDPESSNSWPASPRICPVTEEHQYGRCCGSVFISTLISALAQSTDLLLPAEGSKDESIQPEHSMTYNNFCQSIARTLSREMDKNPEWHDFHFAAQDDFWHACHLGRSGVPPGYFTKRWADAPVLPTTLENSPCNPDPNNRWELSASDKLALCNPDPKSHWNTATLSAERRWSMMTGSSNPSIIRGNLVFPSHCREPFARQSMQAKALLVAGTMSLEWTGGNHLSNRYVLFEYGKGKMVYEDEIVAFVNFRLEVAGLVDKLMCKYGIPRPCGQTCLGWNEFIWYAARPKELQEQEHSILALLRQEPLLQFRLPPRQKRPRTGRFSTDVTGSRPQGYLAAGYIISKKSMDEIRDTILLMVEGIRSNARYYERIVRAEEWFQSIQKRPVALAEDGLEGIQR